MSTGILSLAAGLAVAVLLTGCGGTMLSGDSLEDTFLDATLKGHPDARIECPDVDNEPGRRFTCDVTGVPGKTKLNGRVTRGDGVALVGLT